MQQTQYGRSGLCVSRLAFGAMGIAGDPNITDRIAPSLLRALEQGVSLIDTARIYPHSEDIIRHTLKQWRDIRPVISTKLASQCSAGFRSSGPVADHYPEGAIRKSVDESLAALGVEQLDIVHLHQWHYRWTHELSWLETLQALQKEGKVGQIAISGQDHEHDALLEIVNSGAVSGIQIIVNLFESRPFNAILPLAQHQSAGVIARCVLDSGGLSGALSNDGFAQRTFLKNAPVAEYRQRLLAIEHSFVPSVAASLSELAIRFALSHPAVSALTLGMTTSDEVDAAVAAVSKGPLPDQVVQTIRRQHVWTKNFYEKLV